MEMIFMQLRDDIQKITVQVPAHLLKDAQKVTGNGITQTVTAGLEKLAASVAYKEFRTLMGKYPDFELDIDGLREDRKF